MHVILLFRMSREIIVCILKGWKYIYPRSKFPNLIEETQYYLLNKKTDFKHYFLLQRVINVIKSEVS